jgi:hypothetical protein
MSEYLITWNVCFGENSTTITCEWTTITCENQEEAETVAYEKARQDFETNAEVLTEDLARDYGIEWGENE